jgi:hypothetical protein
MVSTPNAERMLNTDLSVTTQKEEKSSAITNTVKCLALITINGLITEVPRLPLLHPINNGGKKLRLPVDSMQKDQSTALTLKDSMLDASKELTEDLIALMMTKTKDSADTQSTESCLALMTITTPIGPRTLSTGIWPLKNNSKL